MFHESQIFCNTYNIFKILVNRIKIFQNVFLSPFYIYYKGCAGAEPRIFVWEGQVATLIYLSRQASHTHIFIYIYIYTHAFLLYIHTFLFDKLYIYTHPTKKKKTQYFQSKLCLMAIFHKIKFKFFIFIVKFLKKFHFKYKLSTFILKYVKNLSIQLIKFSKT